MLAGQGIDLDRSTLVHWIARGVVAEAATHAAAGARDVGNQDFL
jgi:hypothetical protein